MTETIVLTSEQNGMTIYITPKRDSILEDVKKIASDAYEHWFSCEDTDDTAYFAATGDYVVFKLEEEGYIEGIDYEMAFGDDWYEEEYR